MPAAPPTSDEQEMTDKIVVLSSCGSEEEAGRIADRLVGDAGLPPEQRITKSNMQYEKGKRTLKGFQGFASEDALQPSGLMGPVRVEFFK